MAKFSNARPGDKVYSLKFGEGEITDIDLNENRYPIVVSFKTIESCFTTAGLFQSEDLTPDLYWSKPEIVEPKRKVLKTEKYFGTMADGVFIGLSRKEAHNCTIPVTLTYETEE